ncbi:MAG: hypothetical protein JNJ75_17390 [Cyclobacteriaceae bacterium]|nr:hypothetical protein [Cyclobacteriaceae bacterium]
MVYGLMRLDGKTSLEAGKRHILAFIRKKKLPEPEWIDQTDISNITHANRQLVSKVKPGDTLIVSRVINLSMHHKNLLDTLISLLKKSCTVLIVQEEAVFPHPAFSADAQLEIFRRLQELNKSIIHEQLSRSRMALRKYKKSGRLGRPKGSSNKASKLDGKKDEIQKLLNDRIGLSGIGRTFKVNRLTVKSFIERNELKRQNPKNKKRS